MTEKKKKNIIDEVLTAEEWEWLSHIKMNDEKRADMIADIVENYMESFDNKIIRSILENGWVGVCDWDDKELREAHRLIFWTEEEE